MNRRREDASIRWGWTAAAAWKGAGASVLLHLLVGVALIAVLSGPPKAPPQVIDLTLLPPPGSALHPHPSAIAATTESPGPRGTPARPGPLPVPVPPPPSASPADPTPTPPSPPAAANPPGGIEPAKPSSAGPSMDASIPGSFQGPVPPAGTGRGAPGPLAGIPGGTTGGGTAGAGTAAGSYAWIRDAIQRASAYPPTARRMGWEGKVVVAFRLLPDGSVRNVRIVRGSGHADLDRGAIDAVRNASPFPRTPGEAEIITPVLFRLDPSP